MVEVVLFHHVQGLSAGVRALATRLAADGHTVHTPDLFDGALPGSIQDGVALTDHFGFEELSRRADAAVAALPDARVYAGISFGAATAQRLAQTRPGALGALLYESCVPLTGEWAFGPWPQGVPVQVHGKDQDPYFASEGDLDAARDLVATVGADLAELFTYSGAQHLFTDSSLSSFDANATDLVVHRSQQLLNRASATSRRRKSHPAGDPPRHGE